MNEPCRVYVCKLFLIISAIISDLKYVCYSRFGSQKLVKVRDSWTRAAGDEKVSQVVTSALPGHMREIFIGEGSNRKKLANNAQDLWNQVSTYARHHSAPEKQSGRAWHLFKKITGQEPMWKFSTAPNVEITRNVINKITQLNMAWKKGMQK